MLDDISQICLLGQHHQNDSVYRKQGLPLTPNAVSLHSSKLHARCLQAGTPTFSGAGMTLAACQTRYCIHAVATLCLLALAQHLLAFNRLLGMLNMHPAIVCISPFISLLCIQCDLVAGHIPCHSTADTPTQPDNQPSVSPDISMLSPELQQQWHVAGNMHLGAIKVKPQRHKGCLAVQQVSNGAATCLDNNCRQENTRHKLPVLLQQATLLAQFSGYYGTWRGSVLRPQQEFESTRAGVGWQQFQDRMEMPNLQV